MQIIFLNKISELCSNICKINKLKKINDRVVYSQIGLTYPPHMQKKVLDYCNQSLKNYLIK